MAGFASRPHARGDGTCQDDMFIGLLGGSEASPPGTLAWRLAQTFGSAEDDEVALSLARAGGGAYVLAGYGRDAEASVPAARAHRVRLSPFSVEAMLSRTYPGGAVERDGTSAFRAIAQTWNGGDLVLAGSLAPGRGLPPVAGWQAATADLQAPGSLVLIAEAPNSDILGAASSPGGRVLAVGRAMRGSGSPTGWFGFIAKPASPAGVDIGSRPDENSAPADRRDRLARFTLLQRTDGRFVLPDTAAVSPLEFLQEQVAAGTQIDVALPRVPTMRTASIAARAAAGDVDLVVTDDAGGVVGFSNNRGGAGELVILEFRSQPLTLSIIAQTELRGLELRVGPSQNIGVPVLSMVQQRLSEEERLNLARRLADGGYAPPAEPGIALGAESVRALLAAEVGAGAPVAPRGLGSAVRQFVTRGQ